MTGWVVMKVESCNLCEAYRRLGRSGGCGISAAENVVRLERDMMPGTVQANLGLPERGVAL